MEYVYVYMFDFLCQFCETFSHLLIIIILLKDQEMGVDNDVLVDPKLYNCNSPLYIYRIVLLVIRCI